MEDIGSRIAELIEESALTHSDFAERIGSSSATISHILKGRNKPSLQVITQIKKAFTNVNIDYLLTGEGSLFEEVTPGQQIAVEGAALPSAFPMEGIRKVNVSGVPSNTPEPEVEEKIVKEINEQSDQSPQRPVDSDIEQVMILYRDGSFKVYRP
jgi:transcriptional regulator with XRE-family HTH domain